MKKSHKITEPYAQIPTLEMYLEGNIPAQRHKITEPYAQIPTINDFLLLPISSGCVTK